jgi:hypothetical protein
MHIIVTARDVAEAIKLNLVKTRGLLEEYYAKRQDLLGGWVATPQGMRGGYQGEESTSVNRTLPMEVLRVFRVLRA